METDKPLLQILLSTYNGEKYLREQLESYFRMDGFEKCCVLIRDDGSTDTTRDILQKYEKYGQFETEYGSNIGVNGSYEWLVKNSDSKCEYFAFSDQDDVWCSDKIKKAISALKHSPQDEIALFASRSCITDEALKKIGISTYPQRGISFYNAMVQNVLPGHTQVFNRAMRNSLATFGFSRAECVDWWLYLLASSMGKIYFDPSCTVLHRQHIANAVGYQLGILEKYRKKARYVKDGKANSISIQLQSFYDIYSAYLSEEYRIEIENYLNSLTSLSQRIRYLQSCKFYRQSKYEDWAVHILYLVGKYNIA